MSATITRLPVKLPDATRTTDGVGQTRGNHFGNHLTKAVAPPSVKADPKAAVEDLGKVVKEGNANPSAVERLLADNKGHKNLNPYERILLQELKDARDALLPEAERVMRQLLS